jgi:hypothetical protein
MIVIWWYIGEIEELKVLQKKTCWEVSFLCYFVYFSTYLCIFDCILPVPTPPIHYYPGIINKYYV